MEFFQLGRICILRCLAMMTMKCLCVYGQYLKCVYCTIQSHRPPPGWQWRMTFLFPSLEQFCRAIWNADSQAIVLILPQIKLNSQLLGCACFFQWTPPDSQCFLFGTFPPTDPHPAPGHQTLSAVFGIVPCSLLRALFPDCHRLNKTCVYHFTLQCWYFFNKTQRSSLFA